MWKRPFTAGCMVIAASRLLPTPPPILSDSKKSNRNDNVVTGFERPGVYLWGSNKNKVVMSTASDDEGNSIDPPAYVKTPVRVPFLDGVLLKDLAISEHVGLAVLESGNVLQWQNGQRKVVAKGKKLDQVRISDKTVVGLSKSKGRVYIWPVDLDPESNSNSNDSIKEVKLPSLWWWEWPTDIAVGKEHMLVRTNRGRIFSGSTNDPETSKGQYGIASMSQFDKPPVTGHLHRVPLLEKYKIAQVAAGDHHSLVRTSDGRVFVFGENLNGQLGISYSYRTANVGAPTVLSLGNSARLSAFPTIVTDIAAGGNVSYVTTKERTESGEVKRVVYSLGNGMSGQLGTGSFAHSQSQPLTVRKFEDYTEFSEELGVSKPIDIKHWSVGSNHTFVTLETSTPGTSYGDAVLEWGSNESGQLGNGKKATVSRPTQLSLNTENGPVNLTLFNKLRLRYLSSDNRIRTQDVSQVIVAGNKCSGLFYKKA